MKRIAQEGLEYTRTIIKFSTNIEQSADNSVPYSPNRFNKMRLEPIEEPEYSLPWIQAMANLAKRYQMGNCCEKTCVAYEYIYRKILELPFEMNTNLELYNDPFSDHFFLVIGRLASTDPINPLTWNKDTIICDPWAESSVYTLDEIDFTHIDTKHFHAISNLYDFAGHEGSLSLYKEILASALIESEETENSATLLQPIFVRRNRFDFIDKHFEIFNANVPMVLESWDLPAQTVSRFRL